MKNIFKILLIVVFSSDFCHSQTPELDKQVINNCKEYLPYGIPTLDKNINYQLICHHGYFLASDLTNKIPLYTVYLLTPEHTTGCIKRSNSFTSDKNLPIDKRANLIDYQKSGFDQGHMSPDGDMSYDLLVEKESFLLSNMVPQMPKLNRGYWRQLEIYVRNLAFSTKHSLLIYTGPIYDQQDPFIGPDKVKVPHSFYKIINDINTNKTLVFIYPQIPTKGINIKEYQSNILEVEKETRISFHLSYDKNNLNTIDTVDINAVNKYKQENCSK